MKRIKFKLNLESLKKKHFLEILLFFFLIFLAWVFREKPSETTLLDTTLNNKTFTNQTFSNKNFSNETFEKSFSNKTLQEKLLSNETSSFLKKRNPFTLEGSYAGFVIPEEPFTLVAVKLGEPKEALLKSFRGEIIKVKKGDTLFDGSKIVEIREKSVILQRIGRKRELKIFPVEVEKWKPKKAFIK